MGIFKKKNSSEKQKLNDINNMPHSIPSLPELPKLPDFPEFEENSQNFHENTLPQLPSFPNNTIGNQFSQNTIKEAIAGKKEVEPEEADDFMQDFEEDGNQMTPQPLEKMNPQKDIMREISGQRAYPSYSKTYTTQRKPEPIFIRLDKFEESLEIFKDAKEQISEIEDLLKNIKELKQKEEEELNSWENQIQEIKKQVEKVDKDIFSKI